MTDDFDEGGPITIRFGNFRKDVSVEALRRVCHDVDALYQKRGIDAEDQEIVNMAVTLAIFSEDQYPAALADLEQHMSKSMSKLGLTLQ